MKSAQLLVTILLIAGLTGCASTPESSTGDNEMLLISIPKDYVAGYSARQENMILTEYIPKGETVQNWTEMITSQTFTGLRGITPQQFAKKIKELGKGACPGIKSTIGEEVIQNGYPTLTWKQICGLNPNTNRVEATLIKAIAGNKNLYTVQKAWAYYPDQEETLTWKHYLEKVMVCDAGIPASKCSDSNTGEKPIE